MRLLPIALLLAACHGKRPARSPGDEYVRAIEFRGNTALDRDALVTGLALHRQQERGGPLDPYLVQVDADRIRGEYLRKGFLGIAVEPRVRRDGDAATVIYELDEGPRAVTRVEVLGVPQGAGFTEAEVRAKLPLRDGEPFDYAAYDQARDALLAVAKDAGYAHAELDARVVADRAHGVATVRLAYDLGPRARFGAIEISGVEGALADAVRARLAFAPGDRYSAAAIARTQRALYAFGRFSTVQVAPTEQAAASRSPVIAMRVAVAEAARHEIRLGAGLGMDPTAFEVRGRVGYTIAGWPFPLDTVTLDLRPAYAYLRDGGGTQPRIRALARLDRQDLFWTDATGEVEAAYNYLAVEAYTSYGPRARLGFSTPLGTERLKLRVGWSLERLDFRAISPLIGPELQMELGLDHAERIGMYEQSLVLDVRDQPLEPRLGAYAELRVAEGTRLAGGGYEFLEVVPELRGYVPVGPVVLAARARAGGIFGDVPPTERLFSGGASSHRGFGERRLSPSVTGEVDGSTRTVPFGGAGLIETGVEARVPITSWRGMPIGGVVFLDGGDVRDDVDQLDPVDLHWAAGLGLRLHTLVGPVRADAGYRLNRTGPMEPEPGSRWAFHISLGEAF